jgi:hypothetical protein
MEIKIGDRVKRKVGESGDWRQRDDKGVVLNIAGRALIQWTKPGTDRSWESWANLWEIEKETQI